MENMSIGENKLLWKNKIYDTGPPFDLLYGSDSSFGFENV